MNEETNVETKEAVKESAPAGKAERGKPSGKKHPPLAMTEKPNTVILGTCLVIAILVVSCVTMDGGR